LAGGTLSGDGIYGHDSIATIEATPDVNYRFLQWIDGNTDNPRNMTITQDTTITAIFASQTLFHLLVTANHAERGSVSGSGDYSLNDVPNMTATANTGYRFLKWNDGNTQSPRTITVLSDTNFMAIFEIMHRVTVTANYSAWGNVTGTGNYAQDSNATINATPNTGYRFLQWNDGNTQNPRTITVTSDTNFTANFEIMHTVTITANYSARGSVTGTGNCPHDSITIITATPNAGHRFLQWDDGNTQSPRTITVTSDTNFIAVFDVMHQITISANNSTRGILAGEGIYPQDSTAIISATAYSGYRFQKWSDGNTQSPRTITVTQPANYIAIFDAMHQITVLENDNTWGTVTGSGIFPQDSTTSITATPNPGYRFLKWDDGNKNNPRTITVTQTATYTAIFEIMYTVTVAANDPARGIVSGSGSFPKDSATTITATANQGYYFAKWSDGNSQNPRSITVTSAMTFTAIFNFMYTVTVNANYPAMGTVTGSGSYPQDSTAIITATPNSGHRFFKWNDGNRQSPRTITVISDINFTATFEVMHQITVLANNDTRGTVTGSGSYPKDSTVTITATEKPGHRFFKWSDGNTNNPRTITVTQTATYTAIFEIMHTVTVIPNYYVRGTVTGNGIYPHDSITSISATANAGNRFLWWSDAVTSNPRTITVTRDTSFEAIFAIQGMYHVSVSANEVSRGIVTGEGDYLENATATVCATPHPGHRFLRWSDGSRDSLRSLTVKQDLVLIAIFDKLLSVMVAANDNTMGSVAGNGIYPMDSMAVISATPNPGYRFRQWHDGNTNNPRTITVTQNLSFTAEFEVLTYHLTVAANDTTRGSVSGSGDYLNNATATIEATSNTGYRFQQWNDGNTDNPRNITITSDTNFTAEFGPLFYRVSVTTNDNTMGSVSGTGDYPFNTTVTIEAIANVGYRFVQWNDGIMLNPRTITVTQDITYTAMFETETGIKEVEIPLISLYPNPTTGNIKVILPDNISNAVFTVYDIQGKVIIRQDINNQDVVWVNNLSAGIYIYNVSTEKEIYQGKLIKQ
jgi:hypothetical protein